jgi:hypothetical protein
MEQRQTNDSQKSGWPVGPFGIRPKNHRTGPDKDKVIKGYYLEDLQPSWTRHLPPEIGGTAAPGCGEDILLENSVVAANLQTQKAESNGNVRPAASSQKLEAPNSHKPEAPVAANLQDQQVASNGNVRRVL